MKRIKKRISSVLKLIKTTCKAMKRISNNNWDFWVVSMDFLYSKLRFHVTLDEYLKYDFHNLKDRYRKYFFLNHHRKKYRNVVTRDYARSKFNVYMRTRNLYRREIILLPHCGENNFVEFVKKHNHVILKPDSGSLGVGIFDYNYTDEASAKELFSTFSIDSPMLCEEFIRQHEKLNELSPASVNSIRVITILKNNVVEIIAATLKTESGSGKIVDNLHRGGIGAQVDIPTGIVSTFGIDYSFNTYTHHPTTGVQIIGFKIPYWEEVLKVVIEAHLLNPKCLIYGWDLAITPDGVDIVEANNCPGNRIMQIDKLPKGYKLIPMLKKNVFNEPKKRKSPYVPNYIESMKSEPEMYADFLASIGEKE